MCFMLLMAVVSLCRCDDTKEASRGRAAAPPETRYARRDDPQRQPSGEGWR